MKFIKRNRLFEGGLFKTPEQVNKDRERESMLSDEEVVAGLANDVIQKHNKKLEDLFVKLVAGKFSHEFMLLFDIAPGDTFFKSSSAEREKGVWGIEHTFDRNTKTLTIDVWCKPKCVDGVVKLPSRWIENFPGRSVILCHIAYDIYTKKNRSDHVKNYIRLIVRNTLEKMKYSSDNETKKLLEELLSYADGEVIVNNIHVLPGYKGDIIVDATTFCEKSWSSEKKAVVLNPISLENRSAVSLKMFFDNMFSFDNEGSAKLVYRAARDRHVYRAATPYYVEDGLKKYVDLKENGVAMLKESLFKNAEQMKRQIEKEAELSDEEIIAQTSNEILRRNIESLLDREYNDNSEENNMILRRNTHGDDYGHETPLYLVMDYRSWLFDSLAWNVSEDMSLNFKVTFRGNDILFDVYTILGEEGLKTLETVTRNNRNRRRFEKNGWLDGDVMIVPFRGNLLNDVVEDFKPKFGSGNFFSSTLRMIAENALQKCQKHSVEESVWKLILGKDPVNLVLNSVHFFGNVQCDLLGSDTRPVPGMYRMSNEDKKTAIEKLRGKIVIENKGAFRVALFDDDEIYDIK